MVGEGAGDREFFIYLLTYSYKLAYLHLITVLVYRNSSPKSHEKGYKNLEKPWTIHLNKFKNLEKPWKIRVNEFILINFTKKINLGYFLWILFKSFRGFVLQNTLLYNCSK